MPKFKITESIPATAVWTYNIEANSKDEAMQILTDNPDMEADNFVCNVDYETDNFNYSTEEVK